MQTGQFARFHYNDWLSPPKVEVELSADGEAQVLPSRCVSVRGEQSHVVRRRCCPAGACQLGESNLML